MSRLYEVLENARLEQEKLKRIKGHGAQLHPPRFKSEAEIMGLYHAVNAALGTKGSRVVELIGTQAGDGCSTITRDLARTAALNPSESVVLLDLHSEFCCSDIADDAAFQYHFDEMKVQTMPFEGALYRMEQDNLTVATISPGSNNAVTALNMADNEDLWNRLKTQFTLILIDVPPATASPIAFSLLKRVDGVVLGIRAETTRWQQRCSLYQGNT